MNEETATVSKAKLEELESRIDAMGEIARECVETCKRIVKLAKGE